MKTQMIKDYEKAQAHLESALKLFQKIGKENQTEWDSDRFAYEVSTIIECDNGESGLNPYINSMKARIAA